MLSVIACVRPSVGTPPAPRPAPPSPPGRPDPRCSDTTSNRSIRRPPGSTRRPSPFSQAAPPVPFRLSSQDITVLDPAVFPDPVPAPRPPRRQDANLLDGPSLPPPGAFPPARCADGTGALVALFFSDDPVDIARAKAICRRCDRRDACLGAALSRAEPAGVWGGELLNGGVVVAPKRPCGRPPKHPRPQVFVDELGQIVDHPGSNDAVPVFAGGAA